MLCGDLKEYCQPQNVGRGPLNFEVYPDLTIEGIEECIKNRLKILIIEARNINIKRNN